MSYLSRPRFNFGGVAYCNPSTANNNDFANIFNVDTLEFAPTMSVMSGFEVSEPPGQQTFSYQGAASASDCRTWLMGLMTATPPVEGQASGQQAHWNYYGDHATRLDSTAVSSIEASAGVVVPSNDPLNGATVSLIGTPSVMQFQDPVIVDLDPYALITSQIFSYGIQVTGKDASGAPMTLISASPTSRAYSYYINVFKNLDPNAIGFQMVSAVFCLAVENGDGLQINTSVNSPALADLAAAAARGAGLQMRFCFYDAIYEISPEDLHAQFASGQYTPNPYIGLNLGTIGVLQPDDLLTAPPGRKLTVQSMIPFQLTSPPCGANGSGKAALGITPANLDLTGEIVTLDCVSTFSECNVKTNTKYDFGPMTLDLVDSDGSRITLGNIPYDQTTYQTYSGMVEIDLSSHPQLAEIRAAAGAGTLVINSVTQNQDVLVESAGLDIETDDRAVYFDAAVLQDWGDPSEQPVPGTAQVTITAFRQGQPVQIETQVNLEYWMCDKSQINPSKPMVNVPDRYFKVTGTTELAPTIYPNPNSGGPPTISVITDQVTIPAASNGTLTLNLTALRPGTSVIRFTDPSIGQVTPNFAWDNCNYACVRILPFDDYRAVSDEQVGQWPYIYANFFNYFALLYPVMSKVIPWGPADAPNNPNIVKQFAANMVTFTDPKYWNSTIYMPITREMSAGKRALLLRWCAQQGA